MSAHPIRQPGRLFAGPVLASTLLGLLCAGPAAAQGAAPPSKRLTSVVDGYPHPSPDGRRVAFQSNRTGRWEIYVMNADGSGVAQLTDAPGDNVTPKWSPDGTRIVFAASPGGNSDVFVMNADGTGRRRLTDHPGDDSHPHWSADGARIVFNSARATPDPAAEWSRQWHEVFTMRPDGGDPRQHTRCRTVCTYPSLSPDGSRILFRKVVDAPGFQWNLDAGPRNSEVFVAAPDGSDEVNLSRSAAFDGWPAWSPDGRRIAFTSNRMGPANVGQVFVVGADGTGLRQVTQGPWSHTQPAWSPDGTRLYVYRLQEDAEGEFGHVVAVDLAP